MGPRKEVECSGVHYKPVVEVLIVRDGREGAGNDGPVLKKFGFLEFEEGCRLGREESLQGEIPRKGHVEKVLSGGQDGFPRRGGGS